MPIIFEGDLAHIASLHLKDKDFVFVAGSLRSDLRHLNASEGHTPLQNLLKRIKDLKMTDKKKSPLITQDNLKAAAFERKNNGEVHRIDDSTPEWIRNKLDSTTFDQKPQIVVKGLACFSASLKKDGDSMLGPWRDLLDNPKQWWDYCNPKLNGLVNPVKDYGLTVHLLYMGYQEVP